MKRIEVILKRHYLVVVLSMMGSGLLAQKVSLNLSRVTVKEFLAKIEEQTSVRFSYLDSDLPIESDVTVKATNEQLEVILPKVLSPRKLTYVNTGKTYAIVKKQPQQTMNFTGKIVDDRGESVIGANIRVKGFKEGTISDLAGAFVLNVPVHNAEIIISYIGYVTRIIRLSGETEMRIVLTEDVSALDEVVVVGYGKQKKANLTGSLVSVGMDVFATRPITNAASGLQGHLPGVTIMNSSSRPGDSSPSIRVRGVGTLNNANPLVLIDGVEGNMNTLNPDDIESVTVLKDAASSSIYGSRAANGVVLVSTKNASKNSAATINYTNNFAYQTPTRMPRMLDAVSYLTLLKEATSNVNKSWGYTQDDVDAVVNGTDKDYRSNTNWVNALTKRYAPQSAHNLSIQGGNKTMGYYMSYGFQGTSGLLAGDAYHAQRNNVRLKVNSVLFDRLTLEGNIGYADVDNWTPTISDAEDSGLFYQALRSSPLVPVRFSDGQWGYGGSSANPVAIASDGGFVNYRMRETSINFNANFSIIEGLDVKALYATRVRNVLRKQQRNIIQHYYPNTITPLAFSSNTSLINQRDIVNTYNNLSFQVDYNKTINNHTLTLLGGFSQEWEMNQQSDAGRQNLISDDLHVLDSGTDLMTNSGAESHWAIRSGFGRLNYNYLEKYLFEANLRYDLSSRFHKKSRGGYFPSASLAWRLTEENFMESSRTYLDNFKMRISYGSLGNQYTNSLYPYLSTIAPSTDMMPIGGELSSLMEQSLASNNILTWEKINMFNVGFDVSAFNNRLSLTYDYFIKNTDGILLKVKLPDVLGVSEPYQNAGVVRNVGWELAASWNDKVGSDFRYGITFNLSDVKNEVVSVGNTADDFSGNQIRAVGYSIDSFWGYKADGLYSVNDFNFDPITNVYSLKPSVPVIEEYRTKIQPGDIRYVDLDGDGDITSTNDRTYLGSPIPRFAYSFGVNAGWKGFDFSMFWQGVGQCDGYIAGMGRHAFTELANYPQEAHLDRWTWENQNPHASYPRFTYEEPYNRNTFSSFWLEDASYLRLKNVQLGYTFPDFAFLEKIHVDKFRLFFSGENICTITNYFSSYDPETPISSGGFYPITATYSLGLSITFR